MIRMIFASSWVMALAALRDRTALLMTFVLPAALFVVFAAIFSGATGKELKLKVGLLDLAKTENTLRFVAAIDAEPSLRIVQSTAGSEAAMIDDVRRGNVDVGLILRGDLARRPDQGPPPILVIEDATRPLAAAIMIGQAQRTLNEKLPNVALARILADVEASGAIAKDEREFLDAAFKKQQAEKSESGFSFARIVETQSTEPGARQGNVLYYAGAVVAVFLLFAASHGALTLIDERDSGISQRLTMGRGGMAAVVTGKFAFLIVQGTIQALIVFAVAWFLFSATFDLSRLAFWLGTCLIAASAAAAIGLGIVAVCKSRKQSESATTFAVLLVSAIGGSMVPRYLMPPWMQEIGWFTPNAWMIQAFEASVRSGGSTGAVLQAWGVLIAIAASGLAVAIVFSIRRTRYSWAPAA
ncbi:ABC transporter permease [Tardiphaga sp. vice352]|uniref:ABC transporter permease n=1 Tax=Tardiphaga sp. vice352 TaxID=2592816 RepID=UPI00349FE3DC